MVDHSKRKRRSIKIVGMEWDESKNERIFIDAKLQNIVKSTHNRTLWRMASTKLITV